MHELEGDPVDERDAARGEQRRHGKRVGFPVDPGDFDWLQQAGMEISDARVPQPTLDQRGRLDDDVIVGDQFLPAPELAESGCGRLVVLVTIREEREERRGVD
jgi:hypothetical protein